jgi:hypothetical protein
MASGMEQAPGEKLIIGGSLNKLSMTMNEEHVYH